LLHGRLPGLNRAMWRAHFDAPRAGFVLLAEGVDGLRGFCAAWFDDGLAYVDTLHMRPGMRGGGLGRALLGRTVAALGATRVALTIIEGNDAARRFYERLGGEAAQPHDAVLHGVPTRARRIAWPDARVLLHACGTSVVE
jgi:ribosomal protein S18 acetylase RimI-like enzyme